MNEPARSGRIDTGVQHSHVGERGLGGIFRRPALDNTVGEMGHAVRIGRRRDPFPARIAVMSDDLDRPDAVGLWHERARQADRAAGAVDLAGVASMPQSKPALAPSL